MSEAKEGELRFDSSRKAQGPAEAACAPERLCKAVYRVKQAKGAAREDEGRLSHLAFGHFSPALLLSGRLRERSRIHASRVRDVCIEYNLGGREGNKGTT